MREDIVACFSSTCHQYNLDIINTIDKTIKKIINQQSPLSSIIFHMHLRQNMSYEIGIHLKYYKHRESFEDLAQFFFWKQSFSIFTIIQCLH